MGWTKLSTWIGLILALILIDGFNSLIWEDENSVVIEANQPLGRFRGNLRRRWPWMLESRSRSDSSGELPCYTSVGDPGYCSEIRECYPSVFLGGSENHENQAMIETLKSIAGPCDPSHFSKFRIELPEGLICCMNTAPSMELATVITTPAPTTKRPTITKWSTATEKMPDAVAAYLKDQKTLPCGYLNNTIYSSDNNRFPWIVALVGAHGHFCAGTLIDKYHVLTAAQCVVGLSAEEVTNMRVYLGDYKLHTTSDGPAIIRKVSRIIYHSSFNPKTLKNDIAILRFRLPAPIGTPRVLPICLPSKKERLEEPDEYFGAKAVLAGWGRNWNYSPIPILKQTSMTIWTNEECRIKYGYLAKNGIPDSMLCAASTADAAQGRSDEADCIGDGGGPLILNSEEGISHIVGIISWNIGCGNFPYVHTRVSSFIPWIEKNILRR